MHIMGNPGARLRAWFELPTKIIQRAGPAAVVLAGMAVAPGPAVAQRPQNVPPSEYQETDNRADKPSYAERHDQPLATGAERTRQGLWIAACICVGVGGANLLLHHRRRKHPGGRGGLRPAVSRPVSAGLAAIGAGLAGWLLWS